MRDILVKRFIVYAAFIFSLSAFFPTYAADVIDINAATSEVLETLPSIGPAKAQAIVDYREQNGRFTAIDQIQSVPGIGTATWEKIKDLITVDKTG